jgi:hypothetical protein
VELDGSSGTYVSTPDSAAASVTGDITLIAWVAPANGTPATQETIIAKSVATGDQRSYRMALLASGGIIVYLSDDGIDSSNSVSFGSAYFASGQGRWVRVTWNAATDVATLYFSDQPVGTEPSNLSWVQESTASTAFSISGIYDSTAPVEIGALNQGTANPFTGKISRAVVIASTDPTATPVVDFNANDYEAGKTWETQSQVNTTNLIPTTQAEFDTFDTGWSVVSDGVFAFDGESPTKRIEKTGVLTVGKQYLAELTVTDYSGSNAVGFGTDMGVSTNARLSANGSVREVFTATSTEIDIFSGLSGAVSATLTVSIIELPDIWTLNGTARAFSPFAAWGDFPGSSGDYFSTPDSAAASVTGDLTVIAWAAADDWTPASQLQIVAKWEADPLNSYILQVNTDGTLRLLWSSNGTDAVIVASTVATGFSDSAGHWVRGTLNSDNGSSGYTVTFWTSDDSPLTPYNQITWTQLGDSVTGSGVQSINDNASAVEIGNSSGGTVAPFAGKIARAVVIASTDPTAAPSVDFDARTFTPGVTTATASTGEVWTQNGNCSIEQNIPSPWDASGPLGYLSEQAGTNLLTYSNDLSNAAWTKNNATSTQNYAIAPDGTKTAQRAIDDSGGGGSVNVFWQEALTVSSGSTTFSGYFKKDQLDWVILETSGYDTSPVRAWFDLTDGVVGTTTSTDDQGIEYVGDGWYRCWIVWSTTTDLAGFVKFYAAEADNDLTVDDDGTSSILAWEIQAEAGSFPTTYIPTTSSSATRNADVLTYSAVGNADSFPMTVSAEYAGLDGSAVVLLSIDDETISNRWNVNLSSGRNPTLFSRASGTTDVQIVAASTVSQGASVKITAVVGSNDNELYLDGVSAGTDTASTPPVVTTIHVGSQWDGSIQPFATTRNLKIYNKRLNDSQVKNL